MHRKGQSYYYVCKNRWIALGPDLARARRKWAELEGGEPSLSVGELVTRYVDVLEAKGQKAASTIYQYRSWARRLAEAFPAPARVLTAQHVALWRDSDPHAAQTRYCISLLSAAWDRAREWGLVTNDVAVVTDKPPGRDRILTDAEFVAIREHAPAWLRLAMNVAYVIGPRRSDILAMRWDQVTDEFLFLRARKTKQRQAFRMTTELADVLAEARQRPILGLYVVATDKGQPISRGMLWNAWRRACAAAGVTDANFHDVRAKAATTADELGQDAQALMGHSTARQTEHYVKRLRTIIAEPVRKKL